MEIVSIFASAFVVLTQALLFLYMRGKFETVERVNAQMESYLKLFDANKIQETVDVHDSIMKKNVNDHLARAAQFYGNHATNAAVKAVHEFSMELMDRVEKMPVGIQDIIKPEVIAASETCANRCKEVQMEVYRQFPS